MAQLGARLNGIEKVVGSSPTRSTGLMREPAERLALLVRKQNKPLIIYVIARQFHRRSNPLDCEGDCFAKRRSQ